PVHSPRRKYALAASLVVIAVLALWGGVSLLKVQKPVHEVMQEAKAYQERGDNISASILYKDVVSREPDNAEAHLLLGKAYIAIGSLLDGEKALKRAQDLGVPAAETIPLAVQILIDLDRHEDALKMLGDSKVLV